jgi:AraC-like DNA-binding protein
MVSPVSHLRQPFDEPDGRLERLKDLVLSLSPRDGHTIAFEDMCVYRFSRPTTYRKSATFGVTLAVALQGTEFIRFGKSELSIDPTRLLVITRETDHERAVSNASPGRPFVGLSLCFGPERVAKALLALAEAGGSTTPEVVPAFMMPWDISIGGALERLLHALGDPVDRKLLVPLAIDEILIRLLRSDAAAAVRSGVAHAADAGRILESMQFIREHHTKKLTVEGLARQVAMSSSHYAHRFSAVARVSPMRYVREVRLDQARIRLLKGGARAGEVGTSAGFESPAHFAREFKRRFGVPPSHYLRATSPK